MIPVSRPFLPPLEDYNNLINKLWDSKWLTNNGHYAQDLERKLKDYLTVPSLHFVSSGTLALQLSLRTLNISNEVITTPFSFVATTTSILWENCTPIFVDINPQTLCIDANKIEEAISDKTEAILATHVYGIPCDVEKIEQIAKKYDLRVIYDAAHAFGVRYKGKSLLNYGDISTLSFHATKLYHTVEGGGIVNNLGEEVNRDIQMLRNFGFENGILQQLGINAKNSEFHAAMGLCNLKYIDYIIEERKNITKIYDSYLGELIQKPVIPNDVEYNYSYYPIIFESEEILLEIQKCLEQISIESRRYFNPSLNTLPYLNEKIQCQYSEDISKRILCLPLYNGLDSDVVEKIAHTILERIK
ncbi:DegT/DnrJ/EryC1/StrS aminotransferase family protein [Paucisalibacillus sp. EB02]|uniref:DegT/DnrJ/EryC1/StrS family aminotransferase n=1 Tax=Paucisalibacillus sp. EB02 TaxID=1347087 RepID=UPI0004B0F737|nr:DegT/DnrJ/EryC1/StrS family aminotransferase [Paucisalibacillus sp. EB02]